MQFKYPVTDINSLEAFYKHRTFGGYYPIGVSNCWHGGVHFQGEEKEIQAVADGEIIAYRISSDYNKYVEESTELRYSTGFVLIRHIYKYKNKKSEDKEFVFYSLYNHLLPYNQFKAGKKVPLLFRKKENAYKLTADVNLRDAKKVKDSDKYGKSIRIVKSGALILKRAITESERKTNTQYIEILEETATEGWAKKEGFAKVKYIIGGRSASNPIKDETGYMKLSSYTEDITYRPNEFDTKNFPADGNVKQCSIAVKAGDFIGYPSICQTLKKNNISICHFEIFAKDENSVKDFLDGNILGEEKQQDYFIFEKEATVERKYPLKPKGSWHVKLLTKGENYSKIEIEYKQREVLYKQLNDLQKIGRNGFYTVKDDDFDAINAIFDDVLLKNSELVFVSRIKDDATKRIVKKTCTLENKIFWVSNNCIGENAAGTSFELSQDDLSELYVSDKEPSDIQSFSIPKTRIEKIGKDTLKRTSGTWYLVEYKQQQGWLKKDDAIFKKTSALKWNDWGFQIIKDDPDDFIYEGGKYGTNFVRRMHQKIDTNKDGNISEEELTKALKDKAIAKQLSTMICYHRTEWGGKETGNIFARAYEKLLNLADRYADEIMRKRIKNRVDNIEDKIEKLGFFSEVDDLKSTTHVYHFHPVKFVEMMKKISVGYKRGDKGKVVLEINIRLAGFGGLLPTEEFTELTEKGVKQFQRDYMKMENSTGIADYETLEKIDEFSKKHDISQSIWDSLKCSCNSKGKKLIAKCNGKEELSNCEGWGSNYGKGEYRVSSKTEAYHNYEYPGMHRSLLFALKTILFYLSEQTEYSFAHISSGYRCHFGGRKTTNHQGKAIDIQFNKGTWEIRGQLYKNIEPLKDIREKFFYKYVNAKTSWNPPNHFGLEPIGLNKNNSKIDENHTYSWIHLDVREFNVIYLKDDFFCKDSQSLNGVLLIEINNE